MFADHESCTLATWAVPGLVLQWHHSRRVVTFTFATAGTGSAFGYVLHCAAGRACGYNTALAATRASL